MTRFCIGIKLPEAYETIMSDVIIRAQRLLAIDGLDMQLRYAGQGLPLTVSVVPAFDLETVREGDLSDLAGEVGPFAITFDGIHMSNASTIHAHVESACWQHLSDLRKALYGRIRMPYDSSELYSPGATLARKLSRAKAPLVLAALRKAAERWPVSDAPAFPWSFTIRAATVFMQSRDNVWSELFGIPIQRLDVLA